MAVAKRQERKKPAKIEQRLAQGQKWGPQVKETSLLASSVYNRAGPRGGKTLQKEETKGQGSLSCAGMHTLFFFLSPLHVFWVGMPPHLEDVFSFIF